MISKHERIYLKNEITQCPFHALRKILFPYSWFSRIHDMDLLMSGPADKMDAVWKLIRTKIDTEDPEPLDRYLGRTHIVEPNKPP